MNYFLVEKENPEARLRYYNNSRSAFYALEQVNNAAGFEKYEILSDDGEIVHVVYSRIKGKGYYDVDPLAPL